MPSDARTVIQPADPPRLPPVRRYRAFVPGGPQAPRGMLSGCPARVRAGRRRVLGSCLWAVRGRGWPEPSSRWTRCFITRGARCCRRFPSRSASAQSSRSSPRVSGVSRSTRASSSGISRVPCSGSWPRGFRRASCVGAENASPVLHAVGRSPACVFGARLLSGLRRASPGLSHLRRRPVRVGLRRSSAVPCASRPDALFRDAAGLSCTSRVHRARSAFGSVSGRTAMFVRFGRSRAASGPPRASCRRFAGLVSEVTLLCTR